MTLTGAFHPQLQVRKKVRKSWNSSQWNPKQCSLERTWCLSKFCSRTFPAAINALIFRHIIKDQATTECVDVVIRFAHGHAVKNYAYGSFRKTGRASFGGHEKKIESGTDSDPRFCQSLPLDFYAWDTCGLRHPSWDTAPWWSFSFEWFRIHGLVMRNIWTRLFLTTSLECCFWGWCLSRELILLNTLDCLR